MEIFIAFILLMIYLEMMSYKQVKTLKERDLARSGMVLVVVFYFINLYYFLFLS